MFELLLLAIGLTGLWLGARLVVQNSVHIARHFNMSDLLIGLTLLAFGTDLPEMFVAIDGALHILQGIESSGVVIGNAIGSSICQISAVLGVTAFLHHVTVEKKGLKLLSAELIGSCLLVFLAGLDGKVNRFEGVALLVAFLIYVFFLFKKKEKTQHKTAPAKPLGIAFVLVVAGLVVVFFASELTVDSALKLSKIWGIRQSFVGAIIVGFGTSLPELAISVKAAHEKNVHLSVGNIIGSNIFDCLVPIGVGASIAPLTFHPANLWFDLPLLIAVSLLVIWFLYRVRGLQKWEGATLVSIYLVYVVVKFWLSKT